MAGCERRLEKIARAHEGIADTPRSRTIPHRSFIRECARTAGGMNLECENPAALCRRRRIRNVKQPMCFAPVVHRRRGVARRCGGDTRIDCVSDGACAAEGFASERQISGQAERQSAVQQLSAVRSGQHAYGNGHVQGRRRTDQPKRLLHYLGCEAVAGKLARYVQTRDSASLRGCLSR